MMMAKKTTVLVTGATGFLGSSVLRALVEHPDIEPVAACRRAAGLMAEFRGEVREGDLRDGDYRRRVVKDVAVVCHAAAWGSMWDHDRLERERFFDPTRELLEEVVTQGVPRFLQASTVAIAAVPKDDSPLDDFAPTRHTGFWPHLDRLVDLDRQMQEKRGRGTTMVTLRLGHFTGAGNRLGLVPALVPRLRTRLVPWLAGGRNRIPLVADADLGRAFALAAVAENLDVYESFNICGPEFPTMREVVSFIAEEARVPRPFYSVPYPAGYAFGWLMENVSRMPFMSSPFLTRSMVHLCENRVCNPEYAARKLGYHPSVGWRSAIRQQLADLEKEGYPWVRLAQLD